MAKRLSWRDVVIHPPRQGRTLLCESEWLAQKSPETQASYKDDKRDSNRIFNERLAENLANHGFVLVDAPGPDVWLLRPRMQVYSPRAFMVDSSGGERPGEGYFIRDPSTHMRLVLEVVSPTGVVVDLVDFWARIQAGLFNPSSGQHMRSGAAILADHVAAYINQRTLGPTNRGDDELSFVLRDELQGQHPGGCSPQAEPQVAAVLPPPSRPDARAEGTTTPSVVPAAPAVSPEEARVAETARVAAVQQSGQAAVAGKRLMLASCRDTYAKGQAAQDVVVAYAPTGLAEDVQFPGTDAGSSFTTCLKRVLMTTSVDPFKGGRVEVRHRVEFDAARPNP